MCRLRIPGGILEAHQFRGVASIAEDLGGGYADITTRANLQIREIGPDKPPEVLMRLAEIGLTSRGAGADNIRNITGSPTAGIDPQELIDTRPHARALHHFILHHRELYGLPRKFNIAFDGGGRVAVLEDTNDIAFSAVHVSDGFGVPSGVYYRLGLGGITGHRDFAHATDVIVRPEDATRVAEAVLRVFIAEGDRTDRTKARLKYVLDRWGVPRFLAAMEEIPRHAAAARRSGRGCSRGRRRTSTAISACILRNSLASITSASLCRKPACPGTRCADLPRSRNASAPARCA